MAPPLSLPRFVPGVPYGESTATNYRPAGYRSETASSVSSVSTGEWGHETDYSDVEFAEEDSAFVWDSLIDLAPVNPQPDMAGSGCQQPVTTSAACGGPPYQEAPVTPPPPVIYQIIAPSRPEVKEVACDAMPLPPSPPPRPVSIDCGTDPLPIVCEDRAVDTHPPPHLQLMDTASGTEALPGAWIEPPRISTWRLAEVAAMILDRHPQMAVDLLADELIRQTLDNSPMESQRRAVRLAMEFGAELLRLSAERLVETISARFGQMDHPPLQAILIYVCDELAQWQRRPALPRQPMPD